MPYLLYLKKRQKIKYHLMQIIDGALRAKSGPPDDQYYISNTKALCLVVSDKISFLCFLYS